MNTFLVYYYKSIETVCPLFDSIFLNDNGHVKLEYLDKTHTFVCLLQAESLEQVFIKMQGENWSPCGEARRVIEGAGTHHTSMRVGDVVYVVERGLWLQVMDRGFAQIGTGTMPQIDILVRY